MTGKQETKDQLLSEIQKLKQQRVKLESEMSLHKSNTENFSSESKFRTVLDNSPFPVAVVDEKDQNILFWSKSAQKLFGHTPGTTDEWYQLAYPDPEYRQEVIERWKPILEKAQNSNEAVNTGEYRISCKDGSVKICELYAQFIPGNLVVTLHDITAGKESFAALAENQTLLAQAQRVAKLGGFSFDVGSMQQTWTEETFRILELDFDAGAPEVPAGINIIAPEYRGMADEAIKKAIEQGVSYDQEWEVITGKGNRKWVRSIGKPSYENDKVATISGSFQDITEKKLMEEELKKHQEQLEVLVAERTQELEEKNAELDRAMRVFVGRETKIFELEKRIKALQGK
ncbi:MAG: PAS domain S-box protein [Candidatus Marinimicrobia bacterium]|nr:PAS domain S-box protein [Candidatus Neomarinimicrobiota bacterium]